jgi:hypothetical protein
MCQMTVASFRITATRAMLALRRRLTAFGKNETSGTLAAPL